MSCLRRGLFGGVLFKEGHIWRCPTTEVLLYAHVHDLPDNDTLHSPFASVRWSENGMSIMYEEGKLLIITIFKHT